MAPRGGLTCVCREVPLFWVLFWRLLLDFWVSFFAYSRISGYHVLVKFDFFKNNPDFGVLILIFPLITLWNVAHRALVSYFLCRNVK